MFFSITLQAFSKENCRPLQLDGVQYLRIQIHNLDDDLVPALLYLLKGVPNMISLYIESWPVRSNTDSNVSLIICLLLISLINSYCISLISIILGSHVYFCLGLESRFC